MARIEIEVRCLTESEIEVWCLSGFEIEVGCKLGTGVEIERLVFELVADHI